MMIATRLGIIRGMFSFADALVLRPLPVARPGEILTVSGTAPDIPGTGYGSLSYPDYLDLRDRNHSFDGLVSFLEAPVGLTENPGALPGCALP